MEGGETVSIDIRREILLHQSAVIDGQRYTFISLLFLADCTLLTTTSQTRTKRLLPQSNRDVFQEELALSGGLLPAAMLLIDGLEISFQETVACSAGHTAAVWLSARYQGLLPRFCPDLCWQLSIGNPVSPGLVQLPIQEAALILRKQPEKIYIGESFNLQKGQTYPYRLPDEAVPYNFRIHNIVQPQGNGPTALVYTAGESHELSFYDRAYLDEPWAGWDGSLPLFLPEELRQGRRVCVCQPPQVAATRGRAYELFSVTRPRPEKFYPLL